MLNIYDIMLADNVHACLLVFMVIAARDVKTVYFSEPVTGLLKPVFYRLPKGLL